jgi:predicted Zn-dependent peptidase
MPERYQHTILPSGLRLVTLAMPYAESVAISLAVDVGTRHEQKANHGVSHFLEHMAFKGTATRSAQKIAEEFDAIGGNLNAYTSMDHTVYYARVLKDDLPVALEILGDIIQNSAFADDEIERERQVILQEIAMHRDMPEDMIMDMFTACAFPDQPIGYSILGTEESVSAMTRQSLLNYVNTHYHTGTMVLVAAGAVDHQAMVDLANRYVSSIPSGTQPAPLPACYAGGRIAQEDDLEQAHLMLGFPGASYHSPDYRTSQLVATALGGGMSSRLFQEIRERQGLAYSVHAFASAHADCGLLGIYAATSEDDAPRAMEAIRQELAKACDNLTEDELTRAKNQLRASILMSAEQAGSQCEIMGRHMLIYNEIRPIPRMIEDILSITRRQALEWLESSLSQPETLALLGRIKNL